MTVLSTINSSHRKERALYQSVLLVAACVWLINGLHSRPDDDSTARHLVKVILPLTSDLNGNADLFTQGEALEDFDEGDDPGVPHTRGGLVFLRELVWPPLASGIRFRALRDLPDNAFFRLFDQTYSALRQKLIPDGFRTRSDVPTTRYPTRKTITPTTDWDKDFDPVDASHPDLNAIEVAEDIEIYGPDVVEETQLFVPPVEAIGVTVDRLLDQFAADIIVKIGNPRNTFEGSYCPLQPPHHRLLKLKDISTCNVGLLFRKVQFKRAHRDEWIKAFQAIFPSKTHVTPLWGLFFLIGNE